MRAPLFYKEKPLFGLDIGQSTVKVVQVRAHKGQPQVEGYGYAEFDPSAVVNGAIDKPEEIAKVLDPLLQNIVVGDLTTDRAITSIPTAHIYSRVLELNGVDEADLSAAVELEAQQYIPLQEDERYLDYTVLAREEDTVRVYIVAAPKNIVDSYLELLARVGIEVYGTEPSLLSIIRAVNNAHGDTDAKIIIDFGSQSSDLAIYNQSIQLTSTAATGGDHITDCIAETLDVDQEKAREIKGRYGIAKSKWQEQLAPELSPILSELANEVQKMLRYHHEHDGSNTPIEQIVIVGGGANLPGLDDFIAHLTGVSVTTCNPWENLVVKPLQPPHSLETTIYTTAVGLALKEMER